MTYYLLDCATSRCYPLRAGLNLIGRGSNSDISVEDRTASRHHCGLVLLQDGRLSVTDLGSQNGTRVNGQRVREPLPCLVGDLLEVGRSCFQIMSSSGSQLITLSLEEIERLERLRHSA